MAGAVEVADQAGQCRMPRLMVMRASSSGELLRQTGFGRRRDTTALKLPFLAVNRIPTQATWRVEATKTENSPAGWTFQEIWPLTPPVRVTEHDVAKTEDTLAFAKDTLRGVFLGSPKGIMVHNLPMRGASGTTLNRLARAEWDWLAATHPPAMVLLQFGGNAVPGMTQPKQARWYAQNMGRLVRNIREHFPSAVVVFVGPSDMGLRPQDYPGLPWVIEALAKEIPEAAVIGTCNRPWEDQQHGGLACQGMGLVRPHSLFKQGHKLQDVSNKHCGSHGETCATPQAMTEVTFTAWPFGWPSPVSSWSYPSRGNT